jgi:hypothetical protein
MVLDRTHPAGKITQGEYTVLRDLGVLGRVHTFVFRRRIVDDPF